MERKITIHSHLNYIKKWLARHDYTFLEGGTYEDLPMLLYLPDYHAAFYAGGDKEVENHVYNKSKAKNIHPFFLRNSEDVQMTRKKLIHFMKWMRAEKCGKRPGDPFQIELYNFLLKGAWQKLTRRNRREKFDSNPAKFYIEFKNLMENKFDGDFEKTSLSFVNLWREELRPKPKKKRKRVTIPVYQKIEPRHGSRA